MNIESLELLLEDNFLSYWDLYTKHLDEFIEQISLTNDFNFTYISLVLLIKEFRESYYSFLKFYTVKYWFNVGGEYNINGKYLYRGLNEQDLKKYGEVVNNELDKNYSVWMLNLEKK